MDDCREESDEEAGFIGRTLAKVTSALTHMTPHVKLAVDLAVVGGVVCGSLLGLVVSGPAALSGVMGTAGDSWSLHGCSDVCTCSGGVV